MIVEDIAVSECTDVRSLIENNMGLVKSLVYKRALPKEISEELIAEGNLALTKAALNYNPESGAKFTTYAHDCVEKSINWYLTKDKTIKFTSETLKLSTQVRAYMSKEGIEQIEMLRPSDWIKLGVMDEDRRVEIIACFRPVTTTSAKSNDDDEEYEDTIEDTSINIENDCINKFGNSSLINMLSRYIDDEYSRKNSNTSDVMKEIIRMIVMDGNIDYDTLCKKFGMAYSSVHKCFQKLQSDETLKHILIAESKS